MICSHTLAVWLAAFEAQHGPVAVVPELLKEASEAWLQMARPAAAVSRGEMGRAAASWANLFFF